MQALTVGRRHATSFPRNAEVRDRADRCNRRLDGHSQPCAHFWQVDLRIIAAEEVREISVEQQRFTGRADLSGHFFFWPTVRVGPGDLAFRIPEGSVSSAGDEIIAAVDARGSCRVRLGGDRLVVADVDLFGNGLRARESLDFVD